MTNKESKFSRRIVALFWCMTIAVVIGFLIYFEQIALLYVLATLALVGLLVVVGFSNLESVDRETVEGFASKEG